MSATVKLEQVGAFCARTGEARARVTLSARTAAIALLRMLNFRLVMFVSVALIADRHRPWLGLSHEDAESPMKPFTGRKRPWRPRSRSPRLTASNPNRDIRP